MSDWVQIDKVVDDWGQPPVEGWERRGMKATTLSTSDPSASPSRPRTRMRVNGHPMIGGGPATGSTAKRSNATRARAPIGQDAEAARFDAHPGKEAASKGRSRHGKVLEGAQK